MQRTVISLEDDDKEWLDGRAEEEGVPMTELVRRAVSLLRERMEGEALPLEEILEETAGIWPEEDGLEYQREIRDERSSPASATADSPPATRAAFPPKNTSP